MEIAWRVLKNLNIDLSCDLTTLLLGVYPEELKTGTLIFVHRSSGHNSRKLQITHIDPSVDERIYKGLVCVCTHKISVLFIKVLKGN